MALRLTTSVIEQQRSLQQDALRKTDPALSQRAAKQVDSLPKSSPLQGKIRVESTPKIEGDAAEIKLSDAARAQAAGEKTVSQALSSATSFIDIASNATEAVNDLLKRARTITTAISEQRTDSPIRESLSQDAESVLTEIDRVVSEAKYNGQSVLNSSGSIYSIDLEAKGNEGPGSIVFAISSPTLSRASLGVDSLNASSLLSDPLAAIDAIDAASTGINTARASVDKSTSTINSLAREFGIAEFQDTRAKREINAEESAGLAGEIAKSLKDSAVEPADLNKLDATRVEALLSDDNESKPASAKESPRPRANSDSAAAPP